MKINFKTTERLGPVLPLPLKNFQNINNLSKKFLIRHHAESIEKNKFLKSIFFYLYILELVKKNSINILN